MGELEERIEQVLNDPAQMAQIMGMAQSLLGGSAAPADRPEPPPGGIPDAPGLTAERKSGGAGDPQTLLRALQPYLSDRRRGKLEKALRITRMAHLAKGALGSLGGAGHA